MTKNFISRNSHMVTLTLGLATNITGDILDVLRFKELAILFWGASIVLISVCVQESRCYKTNLPMP